MLNEHDLEANASQIQIMWDDLNAFSAGLDGVDSVPPENADAFRRQLRERQIEFSYLTCKLLFEPFEDVKVTLGLDQPFHGMAYVSIEGPTLRFLNSRWFSMAASFANNVEIYPKTNKKTCMNLTFYSR